MLGRTLSHYKVLEEISRGGMAKASEYFGRFYKYWKDGDLDRERVEEAKGKLGSMKVG